ncbi:hypothetical protein [Malikia spinosa]
MKKPLPAGCTEVGLARSARSVNPTCKPLILKDFWVAADSIKP